MAQKIYLTMLLALILSFDLCCQTYATQKPTRSPRNFTKIVGTKISENSETFYSWGYGGALIFDGLWKANGSFQIPFESQINSYLDLYKADQNQYGYKILHNITVPFGEAVGDTIGLFPITYLNRVQSYSPKLNYNKDTDMYIVNNVVEKYLLPWPRRLPDGTFSRDKGWEGEQDKNASFLWGDDQYMGLTLLARLAAFSHNSSLAVFAAKQSIAFAKYMRDPSDGLFSHGYNYADNKRSCCKWGRANGWGMMSHTEVLQSLEIFPDLLQSSLYQDVLTIYQDHCKAIADVQSSDGKWHQVLNESSTYLETTGTAMFISSIAKGIGFKWLDAKQYLPILYKGWVGLNKVVEEDGTVNGACSGTGIMTSVEDYNERPTPYLTSKNTGLGAVLYAGVEISKVIQDVDLLIYT